MRGVRAADSIPDRHDRVQRMLRVLRELGENAGKIAEIDGGEITDRVVVEDGWAVATALGSADRRTLYLIVNTTTHEEFAQGISRGRIAARVRELLG